MDGKVQMFVPIKLKKLEPNAVVPEIKSALASGADLCACEHGSIAPGSVELVSTGIAVAIPEGYEIQVRSRSGLAAKKGVFVLNAPGTVDADYRGDVKIILANFGKLTFDYQPGDRLAQMVCAAVTQARYEVVDELDETERGEGGFGSTGV